MDSRFLKSLLFATIFSLFGCAQPFSTLKSNTTSPQSPSAKHESPLETPPSKSPDPSLTLEEAPEQKHDRADNKKPEDRHIVEEGFIKPTIYYFPISNEDATRCKQQIDIVDKRGVALIKVCRSTFNLCSEQGSCAVIQKGHKRSFNILGKVLGQERYFETTKDTCRFGYGVKSSCLDPFYTLAADLSIYQPGDVIHIPAIRGLRLPDGSQHSGYFLVRDQGRGVIGKGRFDFFSGYFSWKSSQNPFSKIGLGSKSTQIPYQKIKGTKAKDFLASRAFPMLPETTIDQKPTP